MAQVQGFNINDQITLPASKGSQTADLHDHIQAIYAPGNTEITKLNGSTDQIMKGGSRDQVTPVFEQEIEKENRYAKQHLSPEEYAQYKTEAWHMALNDINPFTGKTNQDDYPEHKKVMGMMDADQKKAEVQGTQELNDGRLNKDRDVASAMYDPKTMKQFDRESKQIAVWEQQHPGEDVDVSKFPLHKRVEEVIAKSQNPFYPLPEFGTSRIPELQLPHLPIDHGLPYGLKPWSL